MAAILEKLSQSPTFLGLQSRVAAMEGGAFASNISLPGQITCGTIVATMARVANLTVGDAALQLNFNGGTIPYLAFDAGDDLSFNRASNQFNFDIGGQSQVQIASNGQISANGAIVATGSGNFLQGGQSLVTGLVRAVGGSGTLHGYVNWINAAGTQEAYIGNQGFGQPLTYSATYGHLFTGVRVAVGDVNFSFTLSGGSPSVNMDSGDNLTYDRTLNRFLFNIANATQAYVETGNARFIGRVEFANDGNFNVQTTPHPIMTFDANDYLQYDRTANKYNFYIGGTKVASIDGSGNMKLLGTLTQSTAP
jgi:hypothetical protein